MIKLTEMVSVAADAVESVTIYSHHNTVEVRMRSGENYTVPCDYGKSVYATHSRIIKEIEEELT